MKKRLIAYLLVSALAVAVFAGCGKKGEGDGADAAATGSTAVAEEAAAADTAAAEVAAVADTAAEIADVAGTSDAAEVADIAVTGDEAVAEVVDEKEVEEAEEETVSVNVRGNKQMNGVPLADFIELCKKQIEEHTLDLIDSVE